MFLNWKTLFGPLALAFFGCGEGPALVPVAPPGLEYSRNIPIPEDQQPQALGETSQKKAGEGDVTLTSADVIDGLPATEPGQPQTTKSGLIYETVKKGDGAEAKTGLRVSVHYVGTFPDGKKFDSSRDRGEPIQFNLGTGRVIKGWDQGLNGMKVGEVRKLIIPPDLAYGKAGKGDIPPDATLHFEVELVDVK